MADHVWTVLSSDFVIDSETNNATLFNTLEQIALIRTPEQEGKTPEVIQLRMALVSLWTRSDPEKPEMVEARYLVKAPSGKTSFSKEYRLNLKKTVRHRVQIRFANIEFAGFGRYQFIVQKKLKSGKWAKVASVPLEVLESGSVASGSKGDTLINGLIKLHAP